MLSLCAAANICTKKERKVNISWTNQKQKKKERFFFCSGNGEILEEKENN